MEAAMSNEKYGSVKTMTMLFAALILPTLLIFVLRGLPSTDRPPIEEFGIIKPGRPCSYLECGKASAGDFSVRVTMGTDATVNKTIIQVNDLKLPLCSEHSRYALSQTWPMNGWRFYAALLIMLFIGGFISLGLIGAGLYFSAGGADEKKINDR